MLPKPDQIKSVAMIAGIGGVLYLAWKAKKAAEGVSDAVAVIVTEKINPASNKNIVFTNTPDIVKKGFTSIFAGLDSIGLLPK
ncbi:MAG: hypothetical protein QM500_04175 [Methylococcales bacterium]